MKSLFALTWFLVGGGLAQASTPPEVGYILAHAQAVYQQNNYVGRVQSPKIVNLQARISGYLVAQNFTGGPSVEKDQLLYVIEPPPYQALVAQAQAALDQARAQARYADVQLTRAVALLHTPAGQEQTVDLARATARSDQAAVLSAQAQLHTAQINLGYTQIRAPINGVISATNVNVGNVVGPQSGTLATIVSDDPMYVNFALPMVDAIRDQPNLANLELLLRLPDGAIYAHTGRIDLIANTVSQSTDTLNWRASFPNPAHALTNGEFVTAVLRSRRAKNRIVIPLAALIADQLGNYVLKIGPGDIVVRQAVTLGQEGTSSVPVLSGIKAGDEIITQGIQSIHPGEVVSPQPAQAD